MGANLNIGATVDVGAINEGMQDVVGVTRAATENLGISFEEVAAKTKSAMRNLSDDVKAAADSVSQESIKVAEATRAQSEAFADLRRATVVTRDAQVDATLAAKLLAAAQEKAAAATAEKAEAQKIAAAAAARAAEEEALSANVIVRAFQRAAIGVKESLSEMQEKLVETAEVSKLSGEGMVAGFSGIGELLGAGIAIGFATHFLDEAAKVNVEIGHLHEKTGIAIESLAGLRQIVKETGAEFDPIANGLVRMDKAQQQVREGNETTAKAFLRLGISIDEVKKGNPEELLQLLANKFAGIEDPGKRAASAIAIFGKSGAALIPVLVQQGERLTENIKKQSEITGITENSVAAAERWTRNMAIFSAEFQKMGNFAIENMHYLVGAFDALGATVTSVFEVVAAAIVSTVKSVGNLGKLIYDGISGNYGQLVEDAKSIGTSFTGVWKDTFKDIGKSWDVVRQDFAKLPPPERTGGQIEVDDLQPKAKKTHDLRFQHDQEELNEMRLAAARKGDEFLLVEEVRFWEQKLAAAKKGSDEYREIVAHLAPLEERLSKRKANPQLQLESSDISKQVAAFEEAGKEEIRLNNETQKKVTEAYRSSLDEKLRIQQEHYSDLEQDTQFEVNQGNISTEERLRILKAASDEEYRLRLSTVNALEQVDKDDAAKYQQDLNKEIELTRQHNRQIVLLSQQSAIESQKAWQSAYQHMTDELNRNVAQWVTTQRGFAQSMAQMLNGITQNFVQNVLKMTEQFLLGLALQKSGQKSQIFADAKTAAANAYASTSAVPIVGPVLAPVAAAAAFAGVMAFESFNEGGVVQQGGGYHVPILAKQGERVLTPTQNTNFESLVNNRTNIGGNNTVNARVTQHFAGSKSAGPNEIVSGVKSALRRGKLSYSG